MKKMSIRILSGEFIKEQVAPDFFERFEILAIYSIDSEIQTEVCRFRLKEGYEIDEIAKRGCIKEFFLLQSDQHTFTCVMKGEFPKEIKTFIRTLEIKIEFPIIIENGFIIMSIIGTSAELHAITSTFIENGWKMEILAVENYNPDLNSILHILTDKQRSILIESYNSGYFDHPRRINAGELAEKMGIHKTTFLEHIHRAEKRLISHLILHST